MSETVSRFTGECEEMTQHELRRYGGGHELRALRFTGERIAHGVAHKGTGNRTTVSVYRTKAGHFVRHDEFSTQWEGQHDSSDITTASTLEALDLPEWAGVEALQAMGIDSAEEVE